MEVMIQMMVAHPPVLWSAAMDQPQGLKNAMMLMRSTWMDVPRAAPLMTCVVTPLSMHLKSVMMELETLMMVVQPTALLNVAMAL